MFSTDDLRVDVATVLKNRAPRYERYIPDFLIRKLEKTICQDELNELLCATRGMEGADFCRGALQYLNVKYDVKHAERLPDKTKRRVVFVSNHPLGALDGIALIDWVSRVYGGSVKFVVNDLLMAVKPLHSVFLPINKHGSQSRKSTQDIDRCFSGDDPIIIFPAGLVSRKGDDGCICDLKWRKMFVNKSVEYGRDIIPLYFNGENSPFFYKFAKLRTKVGLKFNIEMIYLPREIFRSKNAHFSISVGHVIPHDKLQGGARAFIEAEAIKRIVYQMKSEITENS